MNHHHYQQEQKKWDDWDKKDAKKAKKHVEESNDIDETTSQISRLTELQSRQRRAQHLERRACAHEKLLLSAYSALKVPQNEAGKGKLAKKGGKDKKSKSKPSPSNQIEVFSSSFIGESFDVMDKDGNLQMHVDSNSKLFKSKGPTDSVDPILLGLLESFCSRLRFNGLDILKLNRDKKWQPRTLTVSKEQSFIAGARTPKSFSGDRISHPEALLWVKKYSKNSTYSANSIDKNGKGGMHVLQLTDATQTKIIDVPPLGKKLKNGKFKNAVSVTITGMERRGISRAVVVQCMNMQDAQFLLNGINGIVALLHSIEKKR